MVADLDEAERHGVLSAAERSLLAGAERPIVIVRRRADSPLASALAPGSPLVGLLLAYTPLHHLLLAAVGRPLVMTSGNLSDEPMARTDEEALRRLGGIADVVPRPRPGDREPCGRLGGSGDRGAAHAAASLEGVCAPRRWFSVGPSVARSWRWAGTSRTRSASPGGTWPSSVPTWATSRRSRRCVPGGVHRAHGALPRHPTRRSWPTICTRTMPLRPMRSSGQRRSRSESSTTMPTS